MEEDQDPIINQDPCLNENGEWPQPADKVMPDITDEECNNFAANTGLDGTQAGNCDDLTALVCAIKQECDAINIDQAIVIAANDDSKCQDDDLPTLASMWSRILRYAQATTCMLCEYDPRLATILKTGRYPQVLMGSLQDGGYPQWVNPDDYPSEDSKNPVTSAGVANAIKDALLSVWHLWEEQPEFKYFAQTLNDPEDRHNLESQMEKWPAEEGDTALVASGEDGTSLLYKYVDGEWTFVREFTAEDDNLKNFGATHITDGYYAENGVYYFDGTWQVMDADYTQIEEKIEELKNLMNNFVLSGDDRQYILTTRPTLGEAKSVQCSEDRSTIVLITG